MKKNYRNYVEIKGDEVEIYNRDQTKIIAIVNLDDYLGGVRDYSVHLTNGRAAIYVGSKKVLLTRFIMGVTDPNFVVDHINGSESLWDHRRSNLRIVTHRENMFNCKLRSDSTTGVKGVCYDETKKRWIAKISGMYIGSYKTSDEAARERAGMEVLVMGPYASSMRGRSGK